MESVRPGGCFVFNPSIARFGDSILMAYRVVLPDMRRRIAICRLDASLHVASNSLIPLSDHLMNSGDWHADPRFCIYGNRLLLHFNDGMGASGRGPNNIYLVEMDTDDLMPRSAPQTLELEGVRQKIEKNWMLFEHEGDLLAVYRIEPHVVLKCVLSKTRTVQCRAIHQTYWDSAAYARQYGSLRGSTPPIRLGDEYFSCYHSVYPVRTLRSIMHKLLHGRSSRNLDYVGGFYSFAAVPPFTPTRFTHAPVLWPPNICKYFPRQMDRRINQCVYPSGAILLNGQWVVSYGAQNAYCCLRIFPHGDLLAAMTECEALL
jgi:predicted GH43/DUF377 family glycosyl hydrolase